MASRWLCVLGLFGATALLGGCSEAMSVAQLPDFAKLPEKVLSKDEQQGKVKEMAEKAQTHQTEAAKQIEGGK
jgi:hypothetical protein